MEKSWKGMAQKTGMNLSEFITLLLGEAGGYLESETRIHKLSFLGLKEHGIPLSASFTWSHWGPFSVQIKNVLNSLERRGLIQIVREVRKTLFGDEYVVNTYKLTEEGRKIGLELRKKLSTDIKKNINRLHECFGKRRLSELLDYVYRNYSPKDI